jgi:hypothetical protein
MFKRERGSVTVPRGKPRYGCLLVNTPSTVRAGSVGGGRGLPRRDVTWESLDYIRETLLPSLRPTDFPTSRKPHQTIAEEEGCRRRSSEEVAS